MCRVGQWLSELDQLGVVVVVGGGVWWEGVIQYDFYLNVSLKNSFFLVSLIIKCVIWFISEEEIDFGVNIFTFETDFYAVLILI